jgi:hypothetical protein
LISWDKGPGKYYHTSEIIPKTTASIVGFETQKVMYIVLSI